MTPLAERAREPVYSPDGDRIAFVTDRDENGTHALGSDEDGFANELYVIDADGGNPERLTNTKDLDESVASWSADGERIVFAREGPARFIEQLMIMDAGGGCAARIAGDATVFDARRSRDYGQPAWRPGAAASAHPELECEEDG